MNRNTARDSMTIEQLQLILQTEGYISNVDNDGDLHFKAQGRHLFARVDEKDPDFVVIFGDFCLDTEGTKEEIDALRAASKAERTLKCVKCMLLRADEDGFHFRVAVECFTDAENLARSIGRHIDIVCSATYRILNALSE